jgi:hypothetical protein
MLGSPMWASGVSDAAYEAMPELATVAEVAQISGNSMSHHSSYAACGV